MNQPILDAYLDELLGPAPGESAPPAARVADDEVAHVAVADAVSDATRDALAVALLDDYDRETSDAVAPVAIDAGATAFVMDTDGVAGAIDGDATALVDLHGEATVDANASANVTAHVEADAGACAHDVQADAPIAAADGQVIVDATPAAVAVADDAAAMPAPTFDADALAAALLEEFDRETASAPKPVKQAPAPAPKPVVDEDLAAALLAEFEQELEARSAPAKPTAPKPPVKPVSAPLPPAEPAARAGAPKRFELPESFAPVPPTRAIETSPPAPAMRPKADGRPGQARTGRWLRVCVDEDRYAVELLSVQEVVRVAPIVSMRGADAAVLGVMNLRGRIVPVFDLGLWLGTKAVCTDERSRIVVVERNDELIGLLVTAVQDVVTLGEAHIEPPLGAGLRGAIVGVARANDAPTVLLDANWLFD